VSRRASKHLGDTPIDGGRKFSGFVLAAAHARESLRIEDAPTFEQTPSALAALKRSRRAVARSHHEGEPFRTPWVARRGEEAAIGECGEPSRAGRLHGGDDRASRSTTLAQRSPPASDHGQSLTVQRRGAAIRCLGNHGWGKVRNDVEPTADRGGCTLQLAAQPLLHVEKQLGARGRRHQVGMHHAGAAGTSHPADPLREAGRIPRQVEVHHHARILEVHPFR
jgi:hypothetical protein